MNWSLAQTYPPFGEIHVCIEKLRDSSAIEIASLLIHEIGHHYTPWIPFYEGGAESAQDACVDALIGR
jgi:hypothetical protein